MNEQLETHDERLNKTQEIHATESNTPETEEIKETSNTSTPKFTKKKIAIIVAVASIFIIASTFLIPSKFERVHNKCTDIAGTTRGSGNYFVVDTYPDSYENLDPNQFPYLLASAREGAIEAIQYANKEFGFSGAVYSQMLETNALMGRQSAENKKYRVTWTYHPDDGLEVTYEKK